MSIIDKYSEYLTTTNPQPIDVINNILETNNIKLSNDIINIYKQSNGLYLKNSFVLFPIEGSEITIIEANKRLHKKLFYDCYVIGKDILNNYICSVNNQILIYDKNFTFIESFIDIEYYITEKINEISSIKENKPVLADDEKEYISYEDIGFGTYKEEDKYKPDIKIPVGKIGNEIYEISLDCTNGYEKGIFIFGAPSSGKSTLIHGIVINGAMKYSSDDLKFWILDFEKFSSADFIKANIPHIKVISDEYNDLNSFLQYLNSEINDRFNKIYRDKASSQHNIRYICDYNKYAAKNGDTIQHNIRNICDYNKYAAKNGDTMERIVVIIDRFDDVINYNGEIDMGDTINLISNIIPKGGCVGIHLIISSRETKYFSEGILDTIKCKINFRKRYPDFSDPTQFKNLYREMRSLNDGESLVSINEYQIKRLKVAYCDPYSFDEYFSKIREKCK